MLSHHIGICSWSLGSKTPQGLASDMRKCGISAVQLALVPLVVDSHWVECSAILSKSGVSILSGMFEPVGEDYSTLETIAKTGGVRQDSTWQKTLELAIQTSQIASNLGLSLVTFHAGFLPHAACKERTKMLDRLAHIAEIFHSNGSSIAFETGQENAAVLLGVLEELAIPNIGVNFDPANMILYAQGDPVESIKKLEPWVRQVHIKDAIATKIEGRWGNEVIVGEGDVDWPSFLAAIPEGVDLIIEREAGDERIDDIQKAISFLKDQGW